MDHLLHLMFRCDGDVMENDVFVGVFGDLNTPRISGSLTDDYFSERYRVG